MENPTYPGALAIFNGARARCIGVPVNTHPEPGKTMGVDLEAMEATLAANRVKLIVLTPDFHNPTGTSMPLASRRKLLELAARHQVPVVEDHIYARLYAREERVPSLKQLDRSNLVIHIDSFAKVAFPGLRVGWIVAAPAAIERLRLVKQTTDLHTDQLAQATLAEFLRRGFFSKHLAKMRKIYASRLQALDEALRKHMPEEARWTRPEGGMCLWLELPPGFDATELLIHAKERGVLFAPGNAEKAAGRASSGAQPRGTGMSLQDQSATCGTIRLSPNPTNKCFGCGGDNDGGMKLTFEQDNEKRRIVGRFVLGERYQGGGGFAHGGIIALLLDEAMGKVCRFREVRAVTAELSVEYLKPVSVEKEIFVEGREVEQNGRNLFMAGEILNENGEVLARGKGRF